ncbi:hypothetical protein KOR42_52680 [Thalassoglobus neptunius]|uniref:Uncharacterized protein n=1 Tax=Thalassoglobus neptunius TaxID=1938619 RepID=A0A5C5VBH7_9PLAN|nr:hypothetical protein [Thalassoglobus neptunius]TWT35052.1 hypothetical protein KOR42_52680 [Thalassoglobus neptunius]
MFTFYPAVHRSGTLTELPRPVVNFRVLDSWDYQKLKVPLQDGEHVQGHSRDGTMINIEGQIGMHSGQPRLSESDMLASLDETRNVLDVNAESGSFRFILFRNQSNGTYRYFEECCATRFEFDLSNHSLYTYSVSIYAANPLLHESLL